VLKIAKKRSLSIKVKQFCDPFVIDSATNPVDGNGQKYGVLKVLAKGEYGLDLYEFNQQGQFDKA